MRSYEEFCLSMGFNPYETPPELKVQWVAYVAGEAIPCKSMNEAIATSSLYENVVTEESKIAHANFFDRREELEEKAVTLFKKYLREQFVHVEDRIYNICLEDAIEYHGIDGYDHIARRLSCNIELYNRITQRS